MHFLSIRMLAGRREIIERQSVVVAEARYVPNAQFLSIPFRSELIHEAVRPLFGTHNQPGSELHFIKAAKSLQINHPSVTFRLESPSSPQIAVPTLFMRPQCLPNGAQNDRHIIRKTDNIINNYYIDLYSLDSYI